MALASIAIQEGNGTTAGTTSFITNTNWGSTDAADLGVATNPITATSSPNCSFLKYQRFHATINDTTAVENLRFWASSYDTVAGCSLISTASDSAYTSPVTATPGQSTAGNNFYLVTTSIPSENIEIGTAFGGSLIADGFSNWVVHGVFIASAAAAVAGPTIDWTLTWSYDEIA